MAIPTPKTVIPIVVFSTLLLTGCKKELPEHERQQLQQKLAAKKRRALAAKTSQPPGTLSKAQQGQPSYGHDHNHQDDPAPMPLEDMDDRKWPKSVKKALYALVVAPLARFPAAVKRLAAEGPPAFEAMTFYLQIKRQPKAKRAAVALMLAELNMFRPETLAQMGRQPDRPFLQRAAIDLLGRQKHPHCQRLLGQLRIDEKPMAAFIDRARSRGGVRFDAKQLATLDGILNELDVKVVKKRILAINDFELESGLLVILGIRGANPITKALVAKRLVVLAAKGDRSRLRRYAAALSLPPILRIASAQALIESSSPDEKALLSKIARDPKDPMARTLSHMLQAKTAGRQSTP